jgi:translation elongation factor TU
MECNNCNTKNHKTAKFCSNCGEKFELQGKTCPNSECKQSDLPKEAVFCPECGTQLSVNLGYNTSNDDASYDQQLQKFQRIDNIMSIDKDQYDIGRPFLMPIEDQFVFDRRTVVTGRIENGSVKKGDRIQVIGFGADNQVVKCAGLEKGGKIVKEARIGDAIGILFDEYNLNIQRGQVVAKPGTRFPNSEFIADTYFPGESQGGISDPIHKDFRLQFWFRTVEINGDIQLLDNEVSIMPDSVIRLRINLVNPIALEDGLCFAIRVNHRTIGTGKILQIL